MNIKSKFNVGDKVFRLFSSPQQTVIRCTLCNDTKQVEIKGTLFNCPSCVGGKYNWYTRWYVDPEPTTVGQVSLVETLTCYDRTNTLCEGELTRVSFVKETYMLAATGVGSGNIWDANYLYSTLEEAQTEANRRNEILIQQENSLPS